MSRIYHGIKRCTCAISARALLTTVMLPRLPIALLRRATPAGGNEREREREREREGGREGKEKAHARKSDRARDRDHVCEARIG